MVRTNRSNAVSKEEILLPDEELIELLLQLQDAKLKQHEVAQKPGIEPQPPARQADASSPLSKTERLPETRIVLVGKSGVGKSASGNTILGKEVFQAELSTCSVTRLTMAKQSDIAGNIVSVVDTPGLYDTSMSQEELALELGRSIYEASPGPHAFLIVLPINGRYTEQEEQAIDMIRKFFGKEALKYTIILFTHGDALEGNDAGELIKKNKALSDLIEECGGRYHTLNNKDKENRNQVPELLEKINRMVMHNEGRFYTNKLFEGAQREKEKEKKMEKEKEKKIKEMQEKMQAEVMRNEKECSAEEILKLKSDLDKEMENFKKKLEAENKGSGFLAFLKKHWKKLVIGAAIAGAVAISVATHGAGIAEMLAAAAVGCTAGAGAVAGFGAFTDICQAGTFAGAATLSGGGAFAGVANSGGGAFAGAASSSRGGAFAGAASSSRGGAFAGAASSSGGGAFAGAASSSGGGAFALTGGSAGLAGAVAGVRTRAGFPYNAHS